MCLKLWLESGWYYCNHTESGEFWKRQSRNKFPNNHFLKSVWKSNCREFHCRTLDSYFRSIEWLSISLPMRGLIKLLKKTELMFTETGWLLFSSSMVWEVTVRKNSKRSLPSGVFRTQSNIFNRPYLRK